MDRTDLRLPNRQDGVDGILRLAAHFGETETFDFLGMLLGCASLAGQARQILAARLVIQHMERNPDSTYAQSRVAVARALGYEGTQTSNFTARLANPGRALLKERGEWNVDPSRDVL